MENSNFIENISTPLQSGASVHNVFGEPIETQGKTIIPVAQIGLGFGGGFGKGHRPAPPNSENKSTQNGEGGGGGGGMLARPKGVYEITAAGTRFIPVNNTGQLLVAALAGLLLRGLFLKKRR